VIRVRCHFVLLKIIWPIFIFGAHWELVCKILLDASCNYLYRQCLYFS